MKLYLLDGTFRTEHNAYNTDAMIHFIHPLYITHSTLDKVYCYLLPILATATSAFCFFHCYMCARIVQCENVVLVWIQKFSTCDTTFLKLDLPSGKVLFYNKDRYLVFLPNMGL